MLPPFKLTIQTYDPRLYVVNLFTQRDGHLQCWRNFHRPKDIIAYAVMVLVSLVWNDASGVLPTPQLSLLKTRYSPTSLTPKGTSLSLLLLSEGRLTFSANRYVSSRIGKSPQCRQRHFICRYPQAAKLVSSLYLPIC